MNINSIEFSLSARKNFAFASAFKSFIENSTLVLAAAYLINF